MLLVLLCFAFLSISCPICWAQGTFGKNKIQYSNLRWSEIEGEHVVLYFYSEESEIAFSTLALAESTAVVLSDTLKHRLSKKVPLVLFSSHIDFQESNIISYLLPEEVGGLTEFVKGRVLVPYTGSYSRFRWVLAHELTHAFMLDKIDSGLKKAKRVPNFSPPTWFSEGLAEYLSAGSNPAAEAALRDAVLSGEIVGIADMWKIEGNILIYREGQSLITYIANTFGFSSIVRLLENWGSERTFEALLGKTLGVSTEELSRRWILSVKAKYYPDVAVREWASSFAEPTVSGRRFNLSPVWAKLKDGREAVVYLGAESESPELRIHVARGKDQLLVKGGVSRQFESLHLFRSRLSASRNGMLAFSAQREEADVVHVFDLERRKRTATIEVPGFISLSSPSWSPDGTELALSGQDASGRSDILVVSLSEHSMTRLTSDFYDDRDPDWSPDGKWIVFSSDRCEGGEKGVRKLFMISPVTKEIFQLTTGASSDVEPRWSPSGRYIAFVSDAGGVPDLFLLDVANRATARITSSMAGVMTPAWGGDDASLYFVALSSGKYDIYRTAVTLEKLRWEGAKPEEGGERGAESWIKTASSGGARSSRPYRRRFGLDVVQGAVGYDPEFAQAGAGQVALSDMLGNEHLLFYVSSGSEYGGSILGTLSGGATYVNLSRRLSYGLGVFSLGTVYDEELELLREERRTGFLLVAGYPLSRFARLDGTIVGRFAQDYLYRDGEKAGIFLLSNYVSYVWDNSAFESNGELAGTRANVTAGVTSDITEGKADYLTMLVDVRENVSLSRRVAYVTRMVLESSFGDEGARFYMGGPWSLRGYGTRALSGKMLFLLNNEVRVPGLVGIVLGLAPRGFPLPAINGAVFADVGATGDSGVDTWRGSLGLGVYVGGGYFPVARLNTAWRTDFVTFDKRRVWEFFVGWNF